MQFFLQLQLLELFLRMNGSFLLNIMMFFRISFRFNRYFL